jgi:hypothetical protein
MISTVTTAKKPGTSNIQLTTLYPDLQSIPLDFNSFYDKYAPAFYGEIKRRLYKDDISQQVLVDVFKKIFLSGEFVNAQQDKIFITALRLVRKEISEQKVNLALKQIFYRRIEQKPLVNL